MCVLRVCDFAGILVVFVHMLQASAPSTSSSGAVPNRRDQHQQALSEPSTSAPSQSLAGMVVRPGTALF